MSNHTPGPWRIVRHLANLPLIVSGSRPEVFRQIRSLQEAAQKNNAERDAFQEGRDACTPKFSNQAEERADEIVNRWEQEWKPATSHAAYLELKTMIAGAIRESTDD